MESPSASYKVAADVSRRALFPGKLAPTTSAATPSLDFVSSPVESPASGNGRYDVVIIGGALSGAATAILLLNERPELKILIAEKSPVFGRRVGEATVEVSAYFLGRVLGLTQYLNQCHLVKQGFRFWFFNSHS